MELSNIPKNLVIKTDHKTTQQVIDVLLGLGCITDRTDWSFTDYQHVCVFDNSSIHPYPDGDPSCIADGKLIYTAKEFLAEYDNSIYTVEYLKGKKIVINPATIEEAEQVIELAYEHGYYWGGCGQTNDNTYWSEYHSTICYELQAKDNRIFFGTKADCSNWVVSDGYQIITAQQFLQANKKQPQMKEQTYEITRAFIGQIYERVCSTYQRDIKTYFDMADNPFKSEFKVTQTKLQNWYNTLNKEIKSGPGLTEKLIEARNILEKEFNWLANPVEAERWIPKQGDNYFYISPLGEVFKRVKKDFIDNDIIAHYNAFQTKEEAEIEAKRTTISRKYREWARRKNGDWEADWKDHSNKYGIVYVNNRLIINYFSVSNYFIECVVFSTRELAEQALKEFGDDLLLLVEYN